MSAAASADGGAAESPASSGASNGRPMRSTILADDDTGDSVLRARGSFGASSHGDAAAERARVLAADASSSSDEPPEFFSRTLRGAVAGAAGGEPPAEPEAELAATMSSAEAMRCPRFHAAAAEGAGCHDAGRKPRSFTASAWSSRCSGRSWPLTQPRRWQWATPAAACAKYARARSSGIGPSRQRSRS